MLFPVVSLGNVSSHSFFSDLYWAILVTGNVTGFDWSWQVASVCFCELNILIFMKVSLKL